MNLDTILILIELIYVKKAKNSKIVICTLCRNVEHNVKKYIN